MEREETSLLSSINVTPFVDVVLVLLVIFMVTAPMIAKDLIDLKLPSAKSTDRKALTEFGVAINRQGVILVNGQPRSEEGLRQEVAMALTNDKNVQALISADEEAAYRHIVKVIDILKTSGLEKFALQVERRESSE